MQDKSIIFFDGYCHLCNGFVNFVIQKDQEALFFFAPLQGDTAKKSNIRDHDSVILLTRENQQFFKSDAALFILIQILPFGACLAPLKWIPRFIRDGIYDVIAANRYRWFGKSETCRLPTPAEKTRFLP